MAAITWPQGVYSNPAITSIGASDPLRNLIIGYITELYNGSEKASEVLETAATAGSLNFLHSSDGDFRGTLDGSSVIGFDFSEISKLYYFNNHGQLVHELPELTVIHEIIHAIGYDDPLPVEESPDDLQMSNAFDFDGDVVRIQDEVAAQLGHLDHIQSNYYSGMLDTDSIFSSFNLNANYTNSQHVDNVVIPESGGVGNDTLDLSNSFIPNSADLIFGLGGDDTIRAGAGNDYIYGGVGNDTIYGGAGNDYLFGEGGNNSVYGEDGNDVLVGTTGANTLSGGTGNDTLWARGSGSVALGGDGDDLIILSGTDVTASGGEGSDTFRIETTSGAPADIYINDPDATDHLFWNGYELLGGPTYNVEWEVVSTPTLITTYTDLASLDDNGVVYYRYTDDPSTVWIRLPDESWITINNFTDGDFGMSIPAVNYDYYNSDGSIAPGPFPFSNIAHDNVPWDYENLSGRANALANYGSHTMETPWYTV